MARLRKIKIKNGAIHARLGVFLIEFEMRESCLKWLRSSKDTCDAPFRKSMNIVMVRKIRATVRPLKNGDASDKIRHLC